MAPGGGRRKKKLVRTKRVSKTDTTSDSEQQQHGASGVDNEHEAVSAAEDSNKEPDKCDGDNNNPVLDDDNANKKSDDNGNGVATEKPADIVAEERPHYQRDESEDSIGRFAPTARRNTVIKNNHELLNMVSASIIKLFLVTV